jgi:hypothetical protein
VRFAYQFRSDGFYSNTSKQREPQWFEPSSHR